MDLFHRYGFNIIGLPEPDESPDRMPLPVEDEKPTLVPLTVPELEKTQKFMRRSHSWTVSRMYWRRMERFPRLLSVPSQR
jgi:hypothetical protein